MSLRRKRTDVGSLDVDGFVWDEAVAGLGLRTQNGRRTWVCRYRVSGVQKQKTIGSGTLPRKAARIEAPRVIAEGRAGRSPIARAKADTVARGEAELARQREEEVRRTRSLGAVAERYLAHAEQELRPSTTRELKRSFGTLASAGGAYEEPPLPRGAAQPAGSGDPRDTPAAARWELVFGERAGPYSGWSGAKRLGTAVASRRPPPLALLHPSSTRSSASR